MTEPVEGPAQRPKPLPIQMLRALRKDRVPQRLGQDAFTLAMVIVDVQDEADPYPGPRRPVGFFRDQLCELCGIPVTNPRRLWNARKALKDDGWLKFEKPINGSRDQATYEMILKTGPFDTLTDPAQFAPAGQVTGNQNAPGEAETRRNSAPNPAQNDIEPGAIQHRTRRKLAPPPILLPPYS